MSSSSSPNNGDAAPSPRRDERSKLASGGARPPPAPADESPGVPGFRTWRGVYFFVLGFFTAMVIALTVFTRYYA